MGILHAELKRIKILPCDRILPIFITLFVVTCGARLNE